MLVVKISQMTHTQVLCSGLNCRKKGVASCLAEGMGEINVAKELFPVSFVVLCYRYFPFWFLESAEHVV